MRAYSGKKSHAYQALKATKQKHNGVAETSPETPNPEEGTSIGALIILEYGFGGYFSVVIKGP